MNDVAGQLQRRRPWKFTTRGQVVSDATMMHQLAGCLRCLRSSMINTLTDEAARRWDPSRYVATDAIQQVKDVNNVRNNEPSLMEPIPDTN